MAAYTAYRYRFLYNNVPSRTGTLKTLPAANATLSQLNHARLCVLTITLQQLVCQFKAVTTITEPMADLVLLKTFTIPVNQVRLIQS